MKEDFDYSLVPHNFIHCLNGQCKHADNCLRYQVTPYIPKQRKSFIIANPACTTPDADTCPYFKPDKMERFALGITHLLDNVPHKEADVIKRQIIAGMNKTTYYRCWRKERLIKPAEQELIRQVLLNKGITEPPLFDEYVEQYGWQNQRP